MEHPSPAESAKKAVAERCWTLVGRRQGPFWYARRRRPTKGDPASVEFDAAWVLEREERKGDVVGFYHTHPHGPAALSRRDVRTMRAWAGAFGKPLLCLIECRGVVYGFRFDNDRSSGERLTACELIHPGTVMAFDDSWTRGNHDSEIPA